MKSAITAFDAMLSPLEQDILKVIWPDRKMRVRAIYEKLKGRRKLALSSVAVLLDRLHCRGVVKRDVETGRGGVRYIYYPSSDQRQFEKNVVETAVNKLIEKFGSTAVSYFNERFSRRKQ
jgi:predicted transcriptional regulator